MHVYIFKNVVHAFVQLYTRRALTRNENNNNTVPTAQQPTHKVKKTKRLLSVFNFIYSPSKQLNSLYFPKTDCSVVTNKLFLVTLGVSYVEFLNSHISCQNFTIFMRACDLAVRVRSPVGTGYLGEIFRGFSSPVRQISVNFRPTRSTISFGRHNQHFIFALLE